MTKTVAAFVQLHSLATFIHQRHKDGELPENALMDVGLQAGEVTVLIHGHQEKQRVKA
jgi:hypothetical protein